MAKTRITTSERLPKECFIEVRGKASFKSSAQTNNKNDRREEDRGAQKIDATESIAENNAGKTSEIFDLNVVTEIREESSRDSESSEVEKPRKEEDKENEDEIVDDDKSDYGAESFCSDDSFKRSEMTNITPRSSLSGSSSLLHSAGLKYDRRITDLIESRRSGDREKAEDDGERSSLLESEMKYLSEEERRLIIDRRQLTRSGRRNMSFTNDELRKIERENQLLLNKIMSHQKPQSKTTKPVSGAPRTSSSAINRKRQQKKIEEDNMILLRRIQRAKPCAVPRASGPVCRFVTM